ncbi:type II toxin-antitoxin system HicB family antitoxin [Patescibacteria group bacterium]|nr:type II toxin-antitoxin system HicB family antitoxin [Patescibacteria group bacterium]
MKLKRKIHQYTAVFEPDESGKGYTVVIPALQGCISEGDTFEEALKNIEEAAALYLEVKKKEKQRIPTERTGIFIAPIQIKI